MNTSGGIPIVRIQFGNLGAFCEELAARGPNVEPVVRICQQVKQAHSASLGPLPIEHVFGHVSFLHRAADVLQLTVLHLYLGQRWANADDTHERAEVRSRIDELYDRVRSTCESLGYTLVDGSAYQEPGARQ